MDFNVRHMFLELAGGHSEGELSLESFTSITVAHDSQAAGFIAMFSQQFPDYIDCDRIAERKEINPENEEGKEEQAKANRHV